MGSVISQSADDFITFRNRVRNRDHQIGKTASGPENALFHGLTAVRRTLFQAHGLAVGDKRRGSEYFINNIHVALAEFIVVPMETAATFFFVFTWHIHLLILFLQKFSNPNKAGIIHKFSIFIN